MVHSTQATRRPGPLMRHRAVWAIRSMSEWRSMAAICHAGPMHWHGSYGHEHDGGDLPHEHVAEVVTAENAAMEPEPEAVAEAEGEGDAVDAVAEIASEAIRAVAESTTEVAVEAIHAMEEAQAAEEATERTEAVAEMVEEVAAEAEAEPEPEPEVTAEPEAEPEGEGDVTDVDVPPEIEERASGRDDRDRRTGRRLRFR